jgi:hypothetical protein
MDKPYEESRPQEAARSVSSRLPVSPHVSMKDIRQAETYSTHYDQRYRSLRNDQIQQLRGEHESARRRLREAIGEEHADALRLRLHELQVAMRRRLKPPSGPDLDYAAVHRERNEAASAFLRDRGVSEDRIRHAVAASHFPALRDQIVDARNISRVIAAGDVPPSVMHHITPAPGWTIVEPPYGGWQQGWDPWTIGGFSWIPLQITQPEIGFVVNDILLFDLDASDIDIGQYTADAQIAFWFTPSAPGLVEVWVEAQCGKALHDLDLVDEWGVSDSSSSQNNYIMMHVLHPNVTGPSLSQTSWFLCDSNGDTAHITREFVSPGDVAFHHLFSDGPVLAHQPVVVRVGTRSVAGSRTNDMEVRSTSTFRWFIRSVQLRTTG